MKVYNFVALVFAVFAFSCSVAGHAHGEGRVAVNSGVVLFVDADRVLSEALVAKDIRAQVDRRKTELQGTFSKRGEKLHRDEEDLVKQKALLSSEAFETKVTEFRKSVEQVNREAEAKMSELEMMYSNALGQVYEKIQQISKLLASERGASIVLFTSKGQVSYVGDDVDVTDRVLEVLNRDLSRVSLGD